MCGIAGFLNRDGAPADGALLVRMRDTLVHRGPDDEGTYIDGPVGLASRRLSIVDLTASGHQPMCNEDGTVWIVFNGEIFNYVELAAELRTRGHRFRSATDTETILHLYEEYGEACLDRLNGMFGFVIWDAGRRVLFAARDRLGIKPFHYHDGPQHFVFASEMKALLEHPAVTNRPSYPGLADYIFVGHPLGEKTVFDDIKSLPPGHMLRIADGRLTTRPYWHIEYNYDTSRTVQQTAEALRALLDDAVRIHCRSDAPLGCHLSGGLDSSTVVVFAARHRPRLKTFSVRFEGDEYYDESPFARETANHVSAESLFVTPGSEQLANLLAALVWHMDAPMPTNGGFAYYTVSELAARHVKVALTGHGGDEVFAGYPPQFLTAFGTTDMFSRRGQVASAPATPARRSLLRRILRSPLRLLEDRGDALTETENLWLRLHCRLPPRQNPLLHREFKRSLGGYSPIPEFIAPFRDAPTDAVLDKCLHHDLRSYLPGLLHMEDRVSMAVSLESRVPLLDYRLIELMATVPPEQKVHGMEPKHLLRRAATPLLPTAIANRKDKAPFPVPVGDWFANDLAHLTRDVVLSPAALDRGIFDADMLRRSPDDAAMMWVALNVEAWFRVFVDRDPLWLAAADAIARRHHAKVTAEREVGRLESGS